MKRVILTLIVAAFVATGSLALAGQGPAEIKMPAKMGEISFPHHAHQTKVPDCKTCHHKGVDAGACRSCHGVKPDAPKMKDAAHKLCKDCHKTMNGPTKCTDCHKK